MNVRNKKFVFVFTLLAVVATAAQTQGVGLPPPEAGAKERIASSPRHGEWISYQAGAGDTVEAYVVYPERKERAPVVVVIHEIFGLSDWVRSVTDQFAADGFLAIAPDFLSGKGPDGKGSRALAPDAARALFSGLDPAQILRRIDGARDWAFAQPSASPRFAVVGYCWGGGISFSYATVRPDLGAAVVYYGTSPAAAALSGVKAPVLGLYGGNDARVTSTVAPAAAELERLGRRFEREIYEGAGHGFLRQQDGQNGANKAAAEKAWDRTVAFLRSILETAPRSSAEGGGIAEAAEEDCEEYCPVESVAFATAAP